MIPLFSPLEYALFSAVGVLVLAMIKEIWFTQKQKIADVAVGKVDLATCKAMHDSITKAAEVTKEELEYIRDRVDKIMDHLLEEK